MTTQATRASADVFLSHSSKDKIFVRMLRGYLRAHNIESWIDEEHFRPASSADVDATDAAIRDALAAVRFLLVIVSQNAIASGEVEKEVRFARGAEGLDIQIIGLVIDQTRLDALPDWLQGVRMKRFTVVPTDDPLDPNLQIEADPLKTLRDEIGQASPLYIEKVQPYFFKQVHAGAVGQNLSGVRTRRIGLWFINGGYSLQSNYSEALRRVAAEPEVAAIDALFLEPAEEKTGGFLSIGSRSRQRAVDDFMIRAGRITRKDDHAKLLGETVALLRDMAKSSDSALDIRVSPTLPTGRFLFFDDLTVFAPYTMPRNVEEPAFLMNAASPFSITARRVFDDAFQAGRVFAQEGG